MRPMGVPVSPAPAGLAGPETAAEHVRNALQLLQFDGVRDGDRVCYDEQQPCVLDPILDAARARLRAALAALERDKPARATTAFNPTDNCCGRG